MYISILANITYTGYISSRILPSGAYRHFRPSSNAAGLRLTTLVVTCAHTYPTHVTAYIGSPKFMGLPRSPIGSLWQGACFAQNFVDSSCRNVHRMHSSSPISHCSSSTLSGLRPALSSAGARTRSCASRKTSSCLLTLKHALLSSETPRLSEQLLLRPQTGSGWTRL
jgi:hypothetical protein